MSVTITLTDAEVRVVNLALAYHEVELRRNAQVWEGSTDQRIVEARARALLDEATARLVAAKLRGSSVQVC